MGTGFFDGIAPLRYEGPQSRTELAFRHYNPDEIVAGKRMADHLRFAIRRDDQLAAHIGHGVNALRVQNGAGTNQAIRTKGLRQPFDAAQWIGRVQRHLNGGDAAVDQAFGDGQAFIRGDAAQDGDKGQGHDGSFQSR